MSAGAAIEALSGAVETGGGALVVSLFGDQARAPGAALSGPALAQVTARLGVRPEALRVALHRLRKSGWIESERQGRAALYRLSAAGRAEVEAAAPRIYASAGATDWHLRLDPEGDPPPDAVALMPGAWLCPGAAEPGAFTLTGNTGPLPDWLTARVLPEPLAAACADFATALEAAEAALGPGPWPPLESCALRVLIVHGWRRLVQSHPALPDSFYPANWRGAETRARVHRMLEALGPPALADLPEAAETGP